MHRNYSYTDTIEMNIIKTDARRSLFLRMAVACFNPKISLASVAQINLKNQSMKFFTEFTRSQFEVHAGSQILPLWMYSDSKTSSESNGHLDFRKNTFPA